ncbi:MAG: DUF4157 domain-containing protein [Anaerolineae bacterium]|nr:DUF4157 domain-containing protein [Anaerolineae bacterium]
MMKAATCAVPLLQRAPATNVVLQRKCACGGNPGLSGECEACREKRLGTFQRSANGSAPRALVPPVVQDVLSSPGQPLDETTRTMMEPRFGHDFSKVRVHTDARATASARAVNALAYTVGNNVVFGSGQFAPNTYAGRKLIAHELTHTIQQGVTMPAGTCSALEVSNPGDTPEREAERASGLVTEGQSYHPQRGAGQQLARQEGPLDEDEAGLPATAPATATGTPVTFGTSCSGGANDPCQQSRCSATEVSTIQGDITRATGYVNLAISALGQSPITGATERALDWYFSDHSETTAAEVRRRLECILACLQDTETNSRFGCHPDYGGSALAYVCVGSSPVCSQVQTNVCLTASHFDESDRVRAQSIIHECAHRVGMSLGEPQSVPDIYRHQSRFMFLDPSEALQNADSFAMFAGAVSEGIVTSILFPVIGLSSGFAAPGTGTPTWQARLYYGAEFQNPILGMFNPTLGFGLSLIGETATGTGSEAVTSPGSLLVSILPGIRIGNARPGASGEGYVSLFGGPALAVGIGGDVDLGAEAGVGVGYRWRWLDVSAGVGYTYDPTREAGMENLATGSVGVTFIPSFFTSPGQ